MRGRFPFRVFGGKCRRREGLDWAGEESSEVAGGQGDGAFSVVAVGWSGRRFREGRKGSAGKRGGSGRQRIRIRIKIRMRRERGGGADVFGSRDILPLRSPTASGDYLRGRIGWWWLVLGRIGRSLGVRSRSICFFRASRRGTLGSWGASRAGRAARGGAGAR